MKQLQLIRPGLLILNSIINLLTSCFISHTLQLSVIIVNYNVRHFLEQCLYSVQKAIASLQAEVIVVDNNSSDNSINYLQPKFSSVVFLVNNENAGFAKACNQGLKLAKGKYILFLNPDTIVPEDCFQKCLGFFDSHPDAGALGIKMLDGSGHFLKESKRSFPSPMTSLFKLFGLARLFPRSKTFSKYHLGYLDENKNHEVDVLAGAFLMVRKEVLDKVGGFDEIFFMYGEDVDLSYRIQKSGYKNYYFSGSSVIHFKGESTRKGSLNYVKLFYNAMSIFVRKHYGGSKAGIFIFLIHIAIWFRAFMAAVGSFIRRIGLPLIDGGLILLSFWLIKNVWNKLRPGIHYDNELLWISFPAFTIFYLIISYYAGLYDRWYKRSELFNSALIATIVLLAAYSLLPEQYRFSRAIILFGALLAFLLISILRWVLVQTHVLTNNKVKTEHPNVLIIGSKEEYEKTLRLMKDAGLHERILGRVAITENDSSGIGHWKKIDMLSAAVPFREVIFCEGTLSFKNIIKAVQLLPGQTGIKFHAHHSHSIVGSHSKDSSGEFVTKENGYKLRYPANQRLKRLIDIIVAVAALITFPVHLMIVKKPFSFFANCFAIVFAQKTWIGYATEEKNLPKLRKGVIASNGIPLSVEQQLPAESLRMVDYWYAKDYTPLADLRLIKKTYRKLGG
jgi:GT2 family glycosyltransferase